jgi:hypothetical protein
VAAYLEGSQYATRGSCKPPVIQHAGYVVSFFMLFIGEYSNMYWKNRSSLGLPLWIEGSNQYEQKSE